jgi:hypothetical protein
MCLVGSGDGIGTRRTGTATAAEPCVARAGVVARARVTSVFVGRTVGRAVGRTVRRTVRRAVGRAEEVTFLEVAFLVAVWRAFV